jgi:hypothetical protein
MKGDFMMVRRQGDWLTARVGDELVMMSAQTGDYVGLTEVGARVWKLIETPQELNALCSKLQEEFEVSAETCRSDVEVFLNELVKHGAISLDPRLLLRFVQVDSRRRVLIAEAVLGLLAAARSNK